MGKWADFSDEAEVERKRADEALAFRLRPQLDPEAAAESQRLARRFAVSPGVAGEFRQDYREQALAEDAEKLLAKSPKLGKWIADEPMRAAAAQDDLDNLSGIEQSVTAIARGARALLAGFGPGLGAAAYTGLSYPFEAIGATTIGGKLRDLGRDSQGVAQRFIGENPSAGIVERGIVSGMQSAGQTLATLPLGFANAARVSGEALMLGAMGALTFGTSYGKARDQGVGVGMSGFLGAADATAEVVTEKFFGAAGLLKDAKAGMGAARLFMRDITREIPGEVGATLWQNFNEWAIVNPEKSVGEFIQEQPAAIGETIIATIVGGGAQVGAIRGVQRVMGDTSRRQALAQEAEAGAQQAEALAKFAAASKVMGRDAETVREFVAEVADEQGDAPTEFYVDAEQLVGVLNQSGMTVAEFEALAPVAAGQLSEPGGLVRLPVSEFVSMGEAAASLVDHIRTAEDMPSRAEAREFITSDEGKRLQGEVERELSRLTERDAFQQDVEKAAAGFRADLDAAGRFTPEANKFLAALPANYYAATAKRLGITVDEFLDRYQLRSTSKAVKAKPGDAAMSQADTKTPAFRKWFGASKVVDKAGQPLVVYHGTTGDFSTFDYSKIGQQGRSEGAGFYFTNSRDVASGYGEPMQVFLAIKKPLRYDAKGFSKSVLQKIVRRAAELEAAATGDPIEDGFLANFGDVRSDGLAAVVREAADLIVADETAVDQLSGIVGSGVSPEFVNKATRDVTGYDGIVAEGFSNEGDATNRIFVAFFPEQIKSAIGNRGTYDPADPSILNQSAQRDMIELRKREAVLKRLLECL